MKENIREGVSNLYGGYFALVMATGIVSIASYFMGIVSLAWLLFLINKAAYIILWLLTLFRLYWYYPNFTKDLTGHSRGPGFFTMVAGTCILGNQFVLLAGDFTTAILLWFIGIFLWLILTYTFFTAVIVREQKPSMETGVHGGWFIAVVATQSVSILGTLIISKSLAWQEYFLFFSLVMYLLGTMQYILIISFVVYRLVVYSLTPKMFIPLYWVDMGAAAITTLAEARLILSSSGWIFLQEILPFLKGLLWSSGQQPHGGFRFY